MQALNQSQRVSPRSILVAGSIAGALALGGALGFAVKPATVVPGPTHTEYVSQPAGGADQPCQFNTSGRKAC